MIKNKINKIFQIDSANALSKNLKDYFKPNEDYLIDDCLNHIFIVLDGVSRDRINGEYPIPSPAAEVSRLFGDEVYQRLLGESVHEDYLNNLEESINYANNQVQIYNSKKNYQSFLPGTVGIISMIRNNTFYFAYIGDCSGRLIRQSKTKLFTYSQTEKIHCHIKEYSSEIVRNIIVNNKKHPYGYGVFNGQPEAMSFVEYGEIKLKSFDTIILTTDGLDKYFEVNDIDKLMLYPTDIINQSILEENKNKSLNSDDKAIIIIRTI